MQVLLVLINKGRLCIYFCLLVHRRAVSGWPERVLLQLCGKLTQVLLSETCPSHLRLELFAFSLSLTHRHAHRHTDTRVPPAPGLPHGDQLGGAPLPVPATPRLRLAELLQTAASPNAETHHAASERPGTREPRYILWCQIATKITLEYPQELRGAASRYKEIERSMGKARHATAELEWADAGEVRQRRKIQAL